MAEYDDLEAIDGARLVARHNTDAEYHRRFRALRNWYTRRMDEIEDKCRHAILALDTDMAYVRLAAYFVTAPGLGEDTSVWRVARGRTRVQNQYKSGKWETIKIQRVYLGNEAFEFGYGPLGDVLVVAVLEETDDDETTETTTK